MSLRFAFVIIFAVLLCRPVLVVSGFVPQKNKLAVMIDSSKSMSIGKANDTRLERISKVFSQQRLLDKLQSKTGIIPEIFSFAENVSPLSRAEIEPFNIKATGNHTDISAAVRNVIGNLGEGNLLGLIMLTDGVNTNGENPAIVLPNLRTPVYFIGPGGFEESVDLAISLPRPPAIGYLNSSVRLRGEISRYGISSGSVKITVLRNQQHYGEIEAQFTKNSNRGDFVLNIPCDEEGAYQFELKIPELPGEITYENNRVSFLLKVVRERLNVLMISGSLSWDVKFIINALSTDPNAHLVSWSRVKDDRWVCSRDFKPMPGVVQPELAKDFAEADILILRGVPYNFIDSFANEIVSRLESGNLGLLLLPGFAGLAQLGYLGTPFESILPVTLAGEEWRGNSGNMVLQVPDTPYNFLKLVDDPIENMEFFATLPKFDGLYEYKAVRPGAEVLLSSTVRIKADPLPFMLRNRVGAGNVIFVCGAPLWPIGFRLVPTDRGFAPYAAMMVNMLKWLANRREDASVSIELSSSRGFVGQPLSIKIWVSDAKHNLLSDAQVSINISDEKGQITPLTCIETSEKGCYEATFMPAFRGLHKIEAMARYQGRDLGRSQADLLIDVPTAEFEDPTVKTALMQQLASETGGIYCSADNIEPLIAAIDAVPGEKLETKIVDLRDSWMLLLILLLLPCFEWYWRRLKGLS